MRTKTNGISNEVIATVTLLAIWLQSQGLGLGLGKMLVKQAAVWAIARDCRLLHLEVFDNNTYAKGFYQNLGVKSKILNMIKPI
ncbi:GNAT family N-acetyltransferase [Thalassotalea sediminis]|uniref:GNAT family N-acetyltransferase n=1 Tax=Thalassotalea sediminis TaxID=1759089 RepID=UPI002573D72A|nr:GNAT family N-acetyltransferase [Thalassotalea sediminis]